MSAVTCPNCRSKMFIRRAIRSVRLWVTRIGFACLSLESRCGTPDRAALPDYVAFLSHVQLKGAISYSVRLLEDCVRHANVTVAELIAQSFTLQTAVPFRSCPGETLKKPGELPGLRVRSPGRRRQQRFLFEMFRFQQRSKMCAPHPVSE